MELSDKKQSVINQCMANLQSFLKPQIEDMKAALADMKQAHTQHIEDLQQKFTDHRKWLDQATSFQ